MKLINYAFLAFLISTFCTYQLSAQVNLSAGLVSYYPLDSLSFEDSIGNNDFPPTSGFQNLVPRTDRHGDSAKAIYMNSSAQRTLNSSTWPSGNSSRSFSIWYYSNTTPQSGQAGYQFLFFQGNESNGNGIGLAYARNSLVFIGYIDDFVVTAPNNIGQWDHVVGTYDGDTAKLYHNGALIGTEAKSWFTIGTNVNFGFFNKASQGGGTVNTNDFSGALDDLRVYDRVLNAQEVSTLYNGQVTVLRNAKQQDQQLVVYPNPVKETLFVRNFSQEEKNQQVQLIDLKGRIVKTTSSRDLKNGLNVSDLNTGVYWLKVGKQQVEKVVVK